jgi:tripartite-type tricarboxylate transporter receptor subunit TctC
MIVTFAAGSGDDVLARILSPKMGEALGQTVVVENIGGAGGMNGASRAARATPDGYEIVMGGTGTFAANQTLYRHPAYDAQKDFEPIGLAAEQPLILITRKDFPADDLRGFIAYAKSHQNSLHFASGGAGSTTHLGCLLLNSAIGINTTHVPYRSTAIAVQDIMAGRIDYACAIASTALGQIKASQVKAIAILTKKRSPIFPELKTADEQGLTGFEGFIWNGLFAPKGTPAAVVQKLHAALDAALSDQSVQKRVRDVGGEVVTKDRRSPQYLTSFVSSEIAKWAKPIEAAGLKID